MKCSILEFRTGRGERGEKKSRLELLIIFPMAHFRR